MFFCCRKYYSHLSKLIYGLGLYVIVVGPFSLFKANHAVTAVFCAITLHQLLDQRAVTFFCSMQSEQCSDINYEKNMIKRMKTRIGLRGNGRKWKNIFKTVYDTKERGGNLTNLDFSTNAKNTNEDTRESTESGPSTSQNVPGTSKSTGDTRKNEDGQINKEGKINKDNKCYNDDGNNPGENEANGTNDSGANAPSQDSNAGSNDDVDESKIYNVFKNLREKLNFNE